MLEWNRQDREEKRIVRGFKKMLLPNCKGTIPRNFEKIWKGQNR